MRWFVDDDGLTTLGSIAFILIVAGLATPVFALLHLAGAM